MQSFSIWTCEDLVLLLYFYGAYSPKSTLGHVNTAVLYSSPFSAHTNTQKPQVQQMLVLYMGAL